MLKSNCVSFTDLQIVPTVSKDFERGKTPFVEIFLYDGLNPTKLCQAAGILTEPAVSVPTDIGAKPEYTAVADPVLEPPGAKFCLLNIKFLGNLYELLMPKPPKANSTVLVLARVTKPFFFAKVTISAFLTN